MLLNAIAALVLAGMMLVPFVNVFVGAVVGAGLAGGPGALFGIVVALLITAAEVLLADLLGWRDLRCPPAEADERDTVFHDVVTAAPEFADPPTIRTGPPSGRHRPHRRPAAEVSRRPLAGQARLRHAR